MKTQLIWKVSFKNRDGSRFEVRQPARFSWEAKMLAEKDNAQSICTDVQSMGVEIVK